MAAEVPVTDVLCEAMEYLSKLGTNLRVRSENLKEKRISKDKLKNAHAVQKAASKVLLICELSKKSLDNVETGVRKVLSLLEASQAPSNIGGKSPNAKNKQKYHYFEYESRKLRIAKKIPLKHYMSVKVLARGMPASMLDKYPVYYNCKLKRQRRRLAEKQKSDAKRKKPDDCMSDVDRENFESNSGHKKLVNFESGMEIRDNNSQRIVSDSDDAGDKSAYKQNVLNLSDDNNENMVANNSDQEDVLSHHNEGRRVSTELLAEENPDNKICDKDSPRKSKDHKQNFEENKSDKENSRKKTKRKKRLAALYSSDSDEELKNNKNKKDIMNEKNLCSDGESKIGGINDNSVNEPESKKIRLMDSDDDSCNRLGSDSCIIEPELEKTNVDQDNDSKKVQETNNNPVETNSPEGTQVDSGEESKPVIRCVNLSKLLRPEVKTMSSEKDSNGNHKTVGPKIVKLSFKENQIKKFRGLSNKKESNQQDEAIQQQKKIDKYWLQKRKEVSEFKPKKFFINIEKLPDLNAKFLLAHNLTKITNKGNVICVIGNETDTQSTINIDAVRNELLNDSESDECKAADKTNKVKKSILNDAESEHDTPDEDQSQKSSQINKTKKKISDDKSKKDTHNKGSEKYGVQAKLGNLNNDIENVSKDNEINLHSETINKSQSKKVPNNNAKSGESHNEDSNIQSQKPTNRKAQSCILDESSDDKLDMNVKNSLSTSSCLLKDSSDEISDKNKEKSASNETRKSQLKTSSATISDVDMSEKQNIGSSTEINDQVEAELLNNISDDDFNGFCKDDIDSPTKIIEKVKSSLLCNSSDENEKDTPRKTKKKVRKYLLEDSSGEKSDKNLKDGSVSSETVNSQHTKSSDLQSDVSDADGEENRNTPTPTKTIDQVEASNKVSDDDFTGFCKDDIDIPTKIIEKVKSSLLCDSSDEISDKNEEDTPTNQKINSSLLNDSSEEKSDKNEEDTPTQTNQKVKSPLLNASSEEKSDKNEEDTPTKTDENIKSSLLNESSEEKSDKNEEDTPPETNLKVKSSLLNDSSEEKSDKNEEDTPTKTNRKVKSSLLNDSSEEKSDKNEEDTPTKTNQKVKSSLLNDSSDEKSEKNEEDTPTKANQKVKSSLLNDSSDEKSDKNDEDTPTKTNQKVKSSLLNDSSDEKSDKNEEKSMGSETLKCQLNDSSDVKSDQSDDDRREKRKTAKSKRKHARRNREAMKKLRYSSTSDSEQEQLKPSRKKLRIPSSSSSEGVRKNTEKRQPQESRSNSNSSDNDVAKSIDQVDEAVDENSNSSVDKMVRSKAKPSGSSSQNSDHQDSSDKYIDGLTNLNSLNKIRRRDPSTKNRDGPDSIRRQTESKATPIIGEDLLKAESSSDVSEDGENNFDQELPPVPLSGLNGDSIDHMAKDDLLGESDSSVSHNDKDQCENAENVDETDEEENLKLRRRKANAISSDSDGGSHRRKQQQQVERMSDFEDSEEESSEPGKKSKRKKKASDSDGSVGSSDGGKKKRRRIKPVNDSDLSGSDTENEGRNKHGRKNIRKVMGKNQLEEATKKAAREEKERIARISERQKLYNNLDFDESGKPDEVVLEKVVLDFDPETKEPLIQVDRGLVKKLKPHQANGIKFMWDACFESVKRIKKDRGSGCILAHCMGLGKTLQVISLTHTLLTHSSLTGVNRVLVVCPLSTVLNWVNEIRMWLKHAEADFDVDVYELSRYKQNSERAFQLQQWFDGGGVCVLGYEMFRNLSADNNKKFKKKMLRSFQESLVDPGPDLVVCDEGHLLKNEKTSLSQSMNRVKTRRRIVLTGTPLQNNLKEYYCMVQFVKPNLLGKYNEYLNRFVNPITNGQYTDSTEHDIRVMKRRSHVLHKMLDGAVQRRDYGVLAPFLPPKHEYVLFITLTDVQVKLYQFYLDNYSRRPMPGKSSGFLFPDFQSLQRIWTHPLVLKYNSERYEIMQQKKREREEEDSEGSLVDFIDDDSTPEETSTEESSDDSSDMSDDSRKKSKKKKSAKKGKGKETKVSTRRGTRANPVEVDDDDHEVEEVVEVKNENPTEWWIKLVEETELDDLRNSHKLVLLFDILRQCETIGDKLLVFSQSLYSLDLIEHFLGKVDEATQDGRIDEKLGGHVGSWSPGVDYFRLDGSTSCENRSIWCKNFNREDNPRARLFLISTRAGGLGINLVAANRVVIFDVSWNPSHDVQSIFRVYRFGQKKPCYVYRFLAMGTMEEKIYERQVTKQAISKRVIDEQQIDRHYAENDLAELYKFEARPLEPRPLPTLPKDRLFAEMLKEHEAQIYKYHEHDSLLENKEEETLSEEERKAAWEDFENEKNKPPPAPFPTAWPMHNGMVPGLLAQQQQQLAYAALAAMLRKDMPNINDNQIRDMLPLIYNSNPGLMQKMSEIYKYAQPGMMNPGMMNPVMNAGGGGAMGGTSGLQYEPPWQRQHQQQQQMRLQQLMQQQNQMGAKFYAGGLGSRDPVAMALQQQRAREIMMGGGGGGGGGAGGRPRGRPPIHTRTPTATSPDVVNLDSD